MTFIRIHYDIKIYVMGLSYCVLKEHMSLLENFHIELEQLCC